MSDIGKQWFWNMLLAYVALAVMMVGSSSSCQQALQQCQFRQIAEGRLPTVQPNVTIQGVSHAECSKLCLDLLGAGCDGISHHQDRKECRVYSNCEARESMSSMAGYKFFDACYARVGEACSRNADCYPANTECRNGTCQCTSLYQYNIPNRVCEYQPVNQPSSNAQGDVRLVDSCSPMKGRLEVFYNGEWGTVCGDDWRTSNVEVVCRQLGFTSGNPPQDVWNRYGPGFSTQEIHLNEVACTGSESRIDQCDHAGWGSILCSHEEDVSVDCDPHT